MTRKWPTFPGGLTLQEMGYKLGLPLTFFAFLAPAGIPEEAKKVLVPALEKAANNPEVIAKLAEHADYPEL